jgi:hypothetical protein
MPHITSNFCNKSDIINARVQAQKWGWILDEDGVVLDFNKDIFNKMQHILAGYDLGLLESKKEYPVKKIDDIVDWFMENYKIVLQTEKWEITMANKHYFIRNWDSPNGLVFVVRQTRYTNEFVSHENAYENARKWGFILDNNGVIYDFDREQFEKTKHTATGYDLGLLETKTLEETLEQQNFYPVQQIYDLIKWWDEKYGDISEKEGWNIQIALSTYAEEKFNKKLVYKIINNKNTDIIQNYYKAIKNAKSWGWIIIEDAIVMGFDMNKFNKKKHLITGYELGLI